MPKTFKNEIPSSLDLSGLTDAQIIQKIVALIDTENAKTDAERDNELVAECFELLAEIMPEEEKRSEQELGSKLASLKAKASYQEVNTAYKQKRGIRIAAILAAAVLIVAAAVSVAYMIKGNDHNILDMPDYQEDRVTVYDGDVTASYISAEEYLKQENIDILFPFGLSDDNDVVSIYKTDHGDGEFELEFKFRNSSVSMNVYNYDLAAHGAPEGSNTVSIPGLSFGMIKSEEGYDAYMLTEKYAYVINALSEELLYEIISSLKEIK